MAKDRILDFGLFLVVVMQVTELFRFFLFLNVSLPIIAASTVIYLSIYLVFNLKLLLFILRKQVIRFFLLTFLLFPLILYPIHFGIGYQTLFDGIRTSFNNLLYVQLSLSLIIFSLKRATAQSYRLINTIFFISLIGLVLNYYFPGLFYAMKLLTWGKFKEGFDYSSIGDIVRVEGLFLKSTNASLSLLLIMPTIFLTLGGKGLLKSVLVLVLFISLVFLTGSRSGLLIFPFIILLMVIPLIKTLQKKFKTSSSKSIEIFTMILPFLLIAVMVLSSLIYYFIPEGKKEILMSRLLSITSSSAVVNDTSVEERFGAQLLYFEKIIQSPIIGYGTGYRKRLMDSNEFRLTSHNSYIEGAFNYGLPYLFLLAIWISLVFMVKSNGVLNINSSFNLIHMLMVIFILYSLFANTVFETRAFFYSYGILLGLNFKQNPIHE